MQSYREKIGESLASAYGAWIPDTSNWNVEYLVKMGSAITGFTYLVGFICVSLHLSKFGISSSEFLRVHYLQAGFWLMLPILASCIFYHMLLGILARLFFEKQFRLHQNTSLSVLLFAEVLVTGIVIGLINIVTSRSGDIWSQYTGFPEVIAVLAVIATVVMATEASQSNSFRTALQQLLGKIRAVRLLIISSLLLFWVVSFSSNTYPLISKQLGGGKPAIVQFVPLNKAAILQLGLPMDSTTGIIGPCRLVFETESVVYVLVTDRIPHLVAVNRKELAGLISLIDGE